MEVFPTYRLFKSKDASLAKKPWIFLGLALLGAIGAETGRRYYFQAQTQPSQAEEVRGPTPNPVPTPIPQSIVIPPEILSKEAEIRAFFAEKRFQEALDLIKAELSTLPKSSDGLDYRSWLERQRWIIMTAKAWVFLEKQNCSAAMTILEEIPEESRPNVALKGMGYCKFLTRDWQDADALLTRFLQSQSADHEALEMLARSKESQGLFEEALEITEELKNVNSDEKAELEIEPLRKSLLAKQDESLNQQVRPGSFFSLHFQPGLSADFLDKVAETVQRTGEKLNLEFGIEPPVKSIEIFFHSSERFSEITHGPEWSGGIYDGQIRLPVRADGVLDMKSVVAIRHEVTHALLSELVQRRNLPTWFQEGFAQIAECEQFCRNYDFQGTTQNFMAIEMFDRPFISMSEKEAWVAYKQSKYMAIHLLTLRPLADIKQMFSLMPSLDQLTSDSIVTQAGWSYPLLYQTAKNSWEKQLSLR